MGRLNGRVAVVTGAASGIGLATSKRFVAEGATVLMVDRDEDAVRKAAAEVGGNLQPFRADVTNKEDLIALRNHIAGVHGRIDVLFANAGIAGFGPFAEVTDEAFDQIVAINLKGTYFTVQTLLPVLRNGASVILTASVSGFTGAPAFSVYSATKAAIRSLARTLTSDLKDRRIRVNAVSPGNVETPIAEHAGMSSGEAREFYNKTLADTPLGRNGQADDIAAAVLYLASEDSAFVSASELVVDGGYAQV